MFLLVHSSKEWKTICMVFSWNCAGPPSEPAEVAVVAYGAQWSTPFRGSLLLLLVIVPLCLAALLLVHNFCSGTTLIGSFFFSSPVHLEMLYSPRWFPAGLRPLRRYPSLPLHCRAEDRAAACLAGAAGASPSAEPCRRIILVYCKPGEGAGHGHVLSGALRALGRILSAAGKAQVRLLSSYAWFDLIRFGNAWAGSIWKCLGRCNLRPKSLIHTSYL